jgi:type IV secretory pathway VirB10-like protein
MTENTGPAGAISAVARFAERRGISRRRASLAAAAVGCLLVVALFVMNQRIQARRVAAVDRADSTAVEPLAEPVESDGQRAAWADPEQARRLAGDTLPGAPSTDDTAAGGGYVPVGGEVGPGEYVSGSAGEQPTVDTVPIGAVPQEEYPGEQRPLSPKEMRVAAFQRAVSSRQLRPRRNAPSPADSAAGPPAPPAGQAGAPDPGPAAELRPYGPDEIEADRRAAERAAEEISPPAPQAASVPAPGDGGTGAFSFASLGARPCREGERILSAGSVITATLMTAINSEAAGPVLARIGRDVYDASLRCVIFPAGTLLVGRYPQGLDHVGRRLVVVWEQVVLGDGRSWPLPRLPAADRQGNTGVAGRVDRRTRERFEGVALLSAIGAAIEYSTPGGGGTAPGPGGYPAPPTARDRAVGAATEPLRGAAERLLDRVDGIRPVLRAAAGDPIAVIVPQTVDLDRPAPAPSDTLPSASRPAPTPS